MSKSVLPAYCISKEDGLPPVRRKMTLKLLRLPMNCVIRYGVVTCNIYGNVIFKYARTGPTPSMRADSYKSAGIFIRIPVQMSMEYGMPTHILTMITVIFATVPSVKNGMALFIHPHFNMRLFTSP